MAHGKLQNTDAYRVKLMGLKEKQPIFEISKKNDAWEYVKEEASFIEWNFESIEPWTYKWEDKDRDIFKLHLSDWVDKYIMNFSYTALSRSILNSLCGAEKLWRLRIEVRWYSKDGKAKNAIKLLNDWKRAEWAMTYEDTQKMVEVITKSDGTYVSSDYSKLDRYFMDQFDSINKKKKVIEFEVEKESEIDWIPF